VSAEDSVAALEATLAQAIADCNDEACASLVAENFTAVHASSGRELAVVLRGDWLRGIKGCRVRNHAVNDVTVSLHGEVAVATVLWTDGEGDAAKDFLLTDVWKSSAGSWLLLERHLAMPNPVDAQ